MSMRLLSRLSAALFLVAMCGTNIWAEVEFAPAKTADEKPSPFTFTLQKSALNGEYLQIWGDVTAPEGTKLPNEMAVVFTAYTADGKFAGRRTQPVRTQGRSRAYVDQISLETGYDRPAKVEWEIQAEGGAAGDGLPESARSEDKTGNDTPLQFEIQKVGTNYSGYAIIGKVSNTTASSYENLSVIVSAFDSKGKFLGRGRASVQPGTVGPGEVGYIDDLGIDTDGVAPAKIEWKVVSRSF